jgi:glycosyltransferase involved in cell wall biosynthesis
VAHTSAECDRKSVTTREVATAAKADPTCSILMPAYNAGRTVGAAIESVLAQTRGDFELIVVNDGSTDDTADRVQPYLDDARVRLICQPNRGQASARNAAIDVACGTYVSLLDSDDVWLPQYLDRMCGRLDEDPSAGAVYTDAWALDDRTRRVARRTVMAPWHPPTVPTDARAFLRALLELGNFVFVGATVRRTVLAEVGGFRGGLEPSEDYELWLRIAARGYRFLRVDIPLAIYRRSAGQMSADQAALTRAVSDVFRIVAEEYDVPNDIRELARQQLPRTRFPPRRPRRVPQLLRSPYSAASRLRHFRLRPPRQVREAFPDLRSL